MKNIVICILILLTACNKKDDLELEIITKKINSLNVKADDFYKYYNSNFINEKAKTIVVYKLTNNTNKTYYFNLDAYNSNLENKCIRMDRAYIRFTDSNNKIIQTYGSSPIYTSGGILPNELKILKELGYNYTKKYNNFIIHPNEVLYFEFLIVLPYGNKYEINSYWVKNFDAHKEYFAELLLNSDGVNYKNNISRVDLKTIQDNRYEVYNGILKSKNKVAIEFK